MAQEYRMILVDDLLLNTLYSLRDEKILAVMVKRIHMFLESDYRQFFVPTETILTGGPVYPQMGRIYKTDFVSYKDQIWRHREKGKKLIPVPDDFFQHSKQIHMVENYGDQGSDGHIEFYLRGYKFVTTKDLELPYEFRGEIIASPACAFER